MSMYLMKCMFDTDDMYTCSYAGATYWYCDSRRRLFNDSKPFRTEKILNNKVANECKGFLKWVSMHDMLQKHYVRLETIIFASYMNTHQRF